VTQEQWQKIMGNNPSHFKYAGGKAPVENVSWQNVRWPSGFFDHLNAFGKARGERYRLPTEAEWEYACRAGTTNAIYTGPLTIKGALNGPELDAIAWYGGNSGVTYPGGFDTSNWRERQFDAPRSGTHPVGQKKPNAWGLYDMLGNVSEWCYDMYTNLPPDSVTNPVISPYDKTGGWIPKARNVGRGGSWYRIASGCRSAFRQPDGAPHGDDAPPTDNYTGFRVVCELEAPKPAKER
jgi:formylglycine-generating enzyme required for sulfatase activity